MAYYSQKGCALLQLHRRNDTLSGRVFTVGHCSVLLIQRLSYIVLCVLLRTPYALLEGLTVFAENTGLVVGRTLVDPSRWRVPVLVSNLSQDTVRWIRFRRWAWSLRCPPYRWLRRPRTSLCAALSPFPCTFVTSWIRRPGTWMMFNCANWRVSFFVIQICFLCFYIDRSYRCGGTRD